jgi:O-antigen/teichoic acid export membrane protein
MRVARRRHGTDAVRKPDHMNLARPLWPGFRFQMSTILPLVRFGMRAAASNIFEQIFKNVDYLLIGWFYGASQLAVYRVAFDVTMEPAMAVGTLVNRTALPVLRASQRSRMI